MSTLPLDVVPTPPKCVLDETLPWIREFMAKLDALISATPTTKVVEMQKVLKRQLEALETHATLHKSDREEMQKYKETYARNMTELVKRRAINTTIPTATPLQTTASTMGHLKVLREPVKKKQKKDKKPTQDGAVAVKAE
jgi:hypothetical protein